MPKHADPNAANLTPIDAVRLAPGANDRTDREPPLVVDLDYTFLTVDVLWETLRRVATSPRTWMALWRNRPASRAALKDVLVPFAPDVTRLPVHEELRTWLAAERARGRRVVLATATHETLAGRVAAHHGAFDDVMATNATRNLKGARKRDALIERFGAAGFVYVGDSRADRAVWAASAGAVVVRSAFGDVAQGLAVPVLREFAGPRVGRALVGLLAPSRWWWALGAMVPTVLADVGVMSPTSIWRVPTWGAPLAAFVACAVLLAIASSLAGDLWHADADRAALRATAIASGELSVPRAGSVLGLLLFATLVTAITSGVFVPVATLALLSFGVATIARGTIANGTLTLLMAMSAVLAALV